MPAAWSPILATTDTPMRQRLTCALLGLLLCGAVYADVRQAPEPELRQLLQQTVAQADSFQDRFEAEVWLLDMSTRMRRYSFYLRKENGDLNRALARYNGSLGKHTYSAKVVGFWHDFWYVKP